MRDSKWLMDVLEETAEMTDIAVTDENEEKVYVLQESIKFIKKLETELAELREQIKDYENALVAAQERLETGIEVNRSGEQGTRVTATSCLIRTVLHKHNFLNKYKGDKK